MAAARSSRRWGASSQLQQNHPATPSAPLAPLANKRRQAEANCIREKYSDRIPVNVEKAGKSDIPGIDKKKMVLKHFYSQAQGCDAAIPTPCLSLQPPPVGSLRAGERLALLDGTNKPANMHIPANQIEHKTLAKLCALTPYQFRLNVSGALSS